MTSNEYNQCDFCCCDTNISSSIKKFTKENPKLTSGLIIGGTLVTASLISPTVRKVTVPTCKLIAKQQLKILAGIGLLSIATLMSETDEFVYTDINDDDNILEN